MFQKLGNYVLIWPQGEKNFKNLCFWSRQLSGTNIGQSPRLLLPLLSSPPATLEISSRALSVNHDISSRSA